jgi:hypothetical protein
MKAATNLLIKISIKNVELLMKLLLLFSFVYNVMNYQLLDHLAKEKNELTKINKILKRLQKRIILHKDNSNHPKSKLLE